MARGMPENQSFQEKNMTENSRSVLMYLSGFRQRTRRAIANGRCPLLESGRSLRMIHLPFPKDVDTKMFSLYSLDSILRGAAVQQRRLDITYSFVWTLGGFAFLLSYVAIAGIWLYIEGILPSFHDDLLPEFRHSTTVMSFKREFIAYLVFQMSFAGIISLWWMRTIYVTNTSRLNLTPALPIGMFAVCLALFLLLEHSVFRFSVGLSAFCFLTSVLIYYLPGQAVNSFEDLGNQKEILSPIPAFLIIKIVLVGSAVCVFVYSISYGISAWYPTILPNDYYEVLDSFEVISDGEKIVIPRDVIARCLGYAGAIENCPVDPTATEQYRTVFDKTFQWQAYFNRLLYHHSYMFVPAQHWLIHGFDRSVLFLYGYGTTITHSIAMWIAGGGISGYFSTYPVLLLAGIFAIALCTAYISRSLALGALASLIALTRLYYIDFGEAFIAASFSSIRYVGLCAQVASVFFVMRGAPRRIIALPATAVFSLFWNFEFAAFGLVAQGLAVLSPAVFLSKFQRAGLMAVMLLLPLGYLLLAKIDASIIQVTSTQFFQIGMPEETKGLLLRVMTMAAVAQVIALGLSFTFKGAERYARLAILPAIMLLVIKYIFNPAGQHLNITLVFLYPVMLVYLPSALYRPGRLPVWMLGAIGATTIIYWGWKANNAGRNYLQRSIEVKETYTAHLEKFTWNNLGESIQVAAPDDFISNRVTAIASQLQSRDSLLIFSPFDHLLSFYVSPAKFCGQFELLSSLVTKYHVYQVQSCLESSQDLLVVYDKKLTEPCPDWPVSNACEVKQRMKRRAQNVFESMRSSLTEVGRVGDLTFFRNTR
jgi:multisubunit Na+/H+ antiporter MnhC subunit